MIRRLWLHRWKAYEDLELELGPGTTFLVAENGVGKTSVIQALHFALFGSQRLLGSGTPTSNAVRGTVGTTAEIRCQLTLGDADIDIQRWVTKAARSGSHESAIRINGERVSEATFVDLLKSVTGVDHTQLALLAVVPEGSVIALDDSGLNVTGTLSSAFGVDRLAGLAAEFDRRARQIDRQTDDLRKSLRDKPQRADAERHRELSARLFLLDELLHRDTARAEWAQYLSENARYEQAVDTDREHVRDLVAQARRLVPELPEPDQPDVDRAFVQQQLDAISAHHDVLARRQGNLEGRLELATQNAAATQSGDAPCPVCLRPMSADEAHQAHAAHERAAAETGQELRSVKEQLAHLDGVANRFSAFLQSAPPAAPGRPSLEVPAQTEVRLTDDELEALRNSITSARAERDAVDSELRALTRTLERYKLTSGLSAQLLNGYGSAERAYLAAGTMKRLADAICAERIAPLAREVQKRWSEVWPAELLTMAPSGALNLAVNEHAVPYSEFSGGQRTLAHVIVRLLALQMATRCPFLVLDEPLEHLDIRNRRLLATLLVRATQDISPLRQVLVTTYEESITRRLSTFEHGSDHSSDIARPPSRVLRIASRAAQQVE